MKSLKFLFLFLFLCKIEICFSQDFYLEEIRFDRLGFGCPNLEITADLTLSHSDNTFKYRSKKGFFCYKGFNGDFLDDTDDTGCILLKPERYAIRGCGVYNQDTGVLKFKDPNYCGMISIWRENKGNFAGVSCE